MKRYFVSYFFTTKTGGWGINNCSVDTDRNANTKSWINDIQKQLIEENDYRGCAIINFKRVHFNG